MMRVLVVPDPAATDVVGGHTTQQVETVAALRRAGIDARIATPEEAAGSDADVVHVFEDVRPLLAHGRPRGRLVVSPIYFPSAFVLSAVPMFRRAQRSHMLDVRLRHHARTLRRPRTRKRLVRDFRAKNAALLDADLVVVNSDAEGRLLQRDEPRLRSYKVAYSGVSAAAFEGDAAEGRQLVGVGDEPFVLSVARVEPRKNLLSLALAMQGVDARLAIVGAVLPGNEQYLAQIRDALPDLVHVPHLDHARVPDAHAASAAHALPSWYETTGLSTLEAFAAGRPAVVAHGPCVEEYFSGCASFCRADDIASIRLAVTSALAGPRGCERDVAGRFSWDRTARELLAAYAS